MAMSASSPDSKFPPDKKERLVLILHPKRVTSIFYYTLSVVLFIVGLIFMALTSFGLIIRDVEAWYLSSLSMIFGFFLFLWAESRHFFILYIITTWNVRIRKGIFRRHTTRVFYDEITECRTNSDPGEKRVGMGDVEICTSRANESPMIIFNEVQNPEGVREIINRFIQTIPDPLPWSHIERN
jgi:membrane protein YdbS with pleckstrin-like domain